MEIPNTLNLIYREQGLENANAEESGRSGNCGSEMVALEATATWRAQTVSSGNSRGLTLTVVMG